MSSNNANSGWDRPLRPLAAPAPAPVAAPAPTSPGGASTSDGEDDGESDSSPGDTSNGEEEDDEEEEGAVDGAAAVPLVAAPPTSAVAPAVAAPALVAPAVAPAVASEQFVAAAPNGGEFAIAAPVPTPAAAFVAEAAIPDVPMAEAVPAAAADMLMSEAATPAAAPAADLTPTAPTGEPSSDGSNPADAVPAAGTASYKRREAAKIFETVMQVPRRPGLCTSGDAIPIMANAFAVRMRDIDGFLYQYDFRVEPEAPGLRMRALFEKWRDMHFSSLVADRATVCTFEGKRLMYTSGPLTLVPGEERRFEIALPGGNRRGGVAGGRRGFERVFTVKVRLNSRLPLRDLHEYLHGTVSREHSVFAYTSSIDVIFRQAATTLLSPKGRVLFDHRNKTSSGTGMEVVPGYTQAIRTAEGSVTLILDVTSSLFFEAKTLVDLLRIAFGRNGLNSLAPGEIDQAERVLRGFAVFPNYQREQMRRPFTIHGITRLPANATYFKLNGRDLTVDQYFYQEYNRRLEFPNLPCVIVQVGAPGRGRGGDSSSSGGGPPVKIYLPLELCTLAPNQKVTRPLGRIDIKSFKPSALRPLERAAQIERAVRLVYDPAPALTSAFGLAPEFKMLNIEARQLPHPRLLFHPSSRAPTAIPVDGRWSMDNHKVYNGVTLARWAVLPFVPCDPAQISRFIARWAGMMRDMGIHVPNQTPPILPPADPNAADIETALQHAYLQAGRETEHPDLLVFILPNKGYQLYHTIKRVCDTVLGVTSQCVTLQVAQQMRNTHMENLCLKVNVKLPGGTNVRVDPALMPCVAEIPTIFMGADVTHPAQEIRSPSIASVVGSMDAFASQYASVARIQPIRAEIILDMGSMVLELLQKFYASTGTKPQRIIFYRDGISEGQFTDVIRTEVAAIRKACKALDPVYAPKLTFIIVQKRHHTRFFPRPGAPVDLRTGNLLPGLVVDSVVTHPFEFDFYIQSHLSQQGLAKPTRYSVLVDENKFAPNHLAELSYRLCFLYPRGSRSVSMVPPAFYAHVCAARAKAHVIDGERNGQRFFALSMVKPELEKAMYFM
ncbi:hypothetical protein H9P43_006707 [Blastocladiella emersonii ATCC 22665]|nr:hypothetical protein H9P43_006707 [Blastocladiella emersonii ATCC 22665]